MQSTAGACVHWTLKGWCKFGSDCSFSHAMEDALQLYRELQLEQAHHYQHHMNLLHLAASHSHPHQHPDVLAALAGHLGGHSDRLLEAVTSSGSSSSGAAAGVAGGQQFSSATASYWYGPTATVPRHHTSGSSSASGGGRAPTGRRPVCVHWKNNCCQYGDACNFAHTGAGSLQLLPHQQVGRRHAEDGEVHHYTAYHILFVCTHDCANHVCVCSGLHAEALQLRWQWQ
jgi:Zinc finger C-x8-C-x5-C-x3-H type (and similar)